MKITVRGRGPFPLDMLRREQCEPFTMADQVAITASQGPALDVEQHRRVRTISLTTPLQTVMRERWKSFGWELIEPPPVLSAQDKWPELHQLALTLANQACVSVNRQAPNTRTKTPNPYAAQCTLEFLIEILKARV